MNLVFATNNPNKLREVQALLKDHIALLSLSDIGCREELPETGDTLSDNAAQKAKYVFEKYGTNCFADDTGLEIEALGGKPGVYSARYAGEEKSAEQNMEKVLIEMKGIENRKACFKTVICLILGKKEYLFEGRVNGTIAHERRGGKGFGYDPIFIPDGYPKSFAEMSLEEKNRISHRGLAVRRLSEFLNSLS